ncbi:MAG: GNAT family N-acetyltransferase [Rhabdaerophilum sp.]
MTNKNVIAAYWVTFRDGAGGPLMGLPLVLRQDGALRVIEMPDCGVSDYLGPVFSPRAAGNPSLQPKAVWTQLKSVLPAADLLRFEGLKAEIDGCKNPLIEHPLATPNRHCGWKVVLPESWEEYFVGLPSRMRENLGKARRRFLRHPGARIAMASSAAEALEWLEHLDRMQSERLANQKRDTQIASASFSQFYRMLAETGIASGEVIMAGLFAENEIVALNYAVRTGNRVTYLRVANIFGPWAPMSPGLLVTEQMIRHVHENGVRVFDFGLGEYDYKKRFGGKPFPLVDIDLPLSAKGLPYAAKSYLRRKLRGFEALRKLTGRKSLTKSPAQKSDD